MNNSATIFKNRIASIMAGEYVCCQYFPLESNVVEIGMGKGSFAKNHISLKRNYEDHKLEIDDYSEEHHSAAKVCMLDRCPPQLRATKFNFC